MKERMKKGKHTQIHEIGPQAREVLLRAITAATVVLLAGIAATMIVYLAAIAHTSDSAKKGGPPAWRPTAFPSVVVVGFEQHQLAGDADARPQVDADDLALGGVLDPR